MRMLVLDLFTDEAEDLNIYHIHHGEVKLCFIYNPRFVKHLTVFYTFYLLSISLSLNLF